MIHLKAFFTCLLIFRAAFTFSQAYSGPGGIIRDDGASNDYMININDLNPQVLNADHGLVSVCIKISHSWISDLDIRLISPSGDNIMLTSALGGDTDHYDNTCFTMTVPVHILDGSPPYNGAYRPFTPLGNVNNGQSGIGKWILRVLDTYPYADGGFLLSWTINFGINAPVTKTFPGTVLPIIMVNTENLTIPNEPRISGRIKVIANESGGLNRPTDAAAFEGFISVEVRGSSSQLFPKKSFSFETIDADGEDLDTSLLGLPPEEDWILYAPYTDKSFLRDALTYHLGNELGEYAPGTRECEVYINGDYQGIYWLEERIKRDKNRVNIKKLNPVDTLGDELTGGYLLKVDRDDGQGSYFVSNYPGTFNDKEIRIVYGDPEGQDLHPKQKAYIRNYFNAFEKALYGNNFKDEMLGYRRYLDINSTLDYFLINELGHNADGYRLSTFFYKDRSDVDSLFHFGPLWDFNLAYGNVDYCHSQYIDGWAYEDSGGCDNTPRWWARLLEDEYYRDRLRCRFDSLRQSALSTENVLDYIDSLSSRLGPAAERNYERWPILGRYVWPNFLIGSTYAEEINYMKEWLIGRLEWLDDNIPGDCAPVSGIVHVEENGITLSPNPTSGLFAISLKGQEVNIAELWICNTSGIVLKAIKAITTNDEIDVSDLPPGVYIVQIYSTAGNVGQYKLVIQH
jgi:subtilisin-like proprotein convertase family protein